MWVGDMDGGVEGLCEGAGEGAPGPVELRSVGCAVSGVGELVGAGKGRNDGDGVMGYEGSAVGTSVGADEGRPPALPRSAGRRIPSHPLQLSRPVP